MTDTEINRLVAETVMGFTKISEADPSYISDYCNDPAAWGALFGWLRAHEWGVSLIARSEDTVEARAKHRYKRGYFGMAEDPLPGRALALAALRAHGVTP